MPKQIGKYEILRTLGQGAMGEVYLANHPAIGREVAIKTILPTAAKGEDAEGRFRREAEAAGRLNHPNLVTIFDFDKDGDVFYLVMEFVKGEDLDDLIRNKALSPSQYLEVLAQVCDGLGHAHRRGIIHRDIKPSNVRVMRDGKNLLAKVMDFGIARVQDSNMTATGIVMGTVSYMAPEYIREGQATAQSDLFAVGVMLYECLAGRKPFPGDNTTTILFKIVSETPPPIDTDALQGISPNVRHVLDKALAKDPAERFLAADDLGKALRACKDPTWSGVLDEATAMLVRQHLAQAPAGTQLLPQAPAGTQLLPAAPAPEAGAATVLPASAAAPATVIPARPRRTGLYAVGAAALVAAGAGGFLLLRPKSKAPEPTPAPVAAAPAPAPTPAPAAPAPAAPAPVPATNPAPAAPVPAPVKAVAPVAAPAPAKAVAPVAAAVPAPAKIEPAAAPKPPDPPKPSEPPPDPMKTIGKLIDTDPSQAVAVLKPLVQDQPGSVDRQGNYLAALYRSKNAWDFERALTRATASGVTVKAMLGIPSFKSAMAEESRLQRTKPPTGVLPPDVMAKVLEGL